MRLRRLPIGAAGLLRGRCATSHWSVRHLIAGHGALALDERVVADGNVLTAAGATAGMDLALSLVAGSGVTTTPASSNFCRSKIGSAL